MQAYGRRALRVDIRSSDLRRCIFILLSGRLNAFLSAPFVAVGHPSIHRFFRFHNRDKMAAVPASTVWFFFCFCCLILLHFVAFRVYQRNLIFLFEIKSLNDAVNFRDIRISREYRWGYCVHSKWQPCFGGAAMTDDETPPKKNIII